MNANIGASVCHSCRKSVGRDLNFLLPPFPKTILYLPLFPGTSQLCACMQKQGTLLDFPAIADNLDLYVWRKVVFETKLCNKE